MLYRKNPFSNQAYRTQTTRLPLAPVPDASRLIRALGLPMDGSDLLGWNRALIFVVGLSLLFFLLQELIAVQLHGSMNPRGF
ncbi:hypothetical protein HanPSC8_Chr10g0449481 [Helianthus annuus]|nr:hypothetical protein HanPSC8_Chr10g0449481 [Helianthus annuus]